MRRSLTDAAGKQIKVTDVGNGVLLPRGFAATTPEQAKSYFEDIPNFRCRQDDIMLLSWPKTGTTWSYEILTLLLHKSAEFQSVSKAMTMLEFLPQEAVHTVPSPRVLNTHVPYRYLPRDMAEKQTKSVLIVRNPKDTVVSLYNHLRGFNEYEYDGEWKDFLKLYMEEGEMIYGLYSDYVKDFERAVNDDSVGFPLHIVHYEELKQNGAEELTKLARFLEVEIDGDTIATINKQCSFDTMSKAKPVSDDLRKQFIRDGFDIYRKGQIGDWKNWFTVAQSEQFDAYWQKQMADSKTKFTYSPNTEPC